MSSDIGLRFFLRRYNAKESIIFSEGIRSIYSARIDFLWEDGTLPFNSYWRYGAVLIHISRYSVRNEFVYKSYGKWACEQVFDNCIYSEYQFPSFGIQTIKDLSEQGVSPISNWLIWRCIATFWSLRAFKELSISSKQDGTIIFLRHISAHCGGWYYGFHCCLTFYGEGLQGWGVVVPNYLKWAACCVAGSCTDSFDTNVVHVLVTCNFRMRVVHRVKNFPFSFSPQQRTIIRRERVSAPTIHWTSCRYITSMCDIYKAIWTFPPDHGFLREHSDDWGTVLKFLS